MHQPRGDEEARNVDTRRRHPNRKGLGPVDNCVPSSATSAGFSQFIDEYVVCAAALAICRQARDGGTLPKLLGVPAVQRWG